MVLRTGRHISIWGVPVGVQALRGAWGRNHSVIQGSLGALRRSIRTQDRAVTYTPLGPRLPVAFSREHAKAIWGRS